MQKYPSYFRGGMKTSYRIDFCMQMKLPKWQGEDILCLSL